MSGAGRRATGNYWAQGAEPVSQTLWLVGSSTARSLVAVVWRCRCRWLWVWTVLIVSVLWRSNLTLNLIIIMTIEEDVLHWRRPREFFFSLNSSNTEYGMLAVLSNDPGFLCAVIIVNILKIKKPLACLCINRRDMSRQRPPHAPSPPRPRSAETPNAPSLRQTGNFKLCPVWTNHSAGFRLYHVLCLIYQKLSQNPTFLADTFFIRCFRGCFCLIFKHFVTFV